MVQVCAMLPLRFPKLSYRGYLEVSWVVISGVISPSIWVIMLITSVRTTHGPPSMIWVWGCSGLVFI